MTEQYYIDDEKPLSLAESHRLWLRYNMPVHGQPTCGHECKCTGVSFIIEKTKTGSELDRWEITRDSMHDAIANVMSRGNDFEIDSMVREKCAGRNCLHAGLNPVKTSGTYREYPGAGLQTWHKTEYYCPQCFAFVPEGGDDE